MRALVARAVRAAGHDVVAEVCDTEAAALQLARECPDAAIVDSRLASGAIAQLVARLRAASHHTAILILASLDEREVVRAALAAGARGAVLRPVKPDALARTLAGLADA